jgi:creatinine amidohydrolase
MVRMPTHAMGIFLEELTWVQAEGVLRPDTVVVIPLGAAAKEHGTHLRLNNDWTMVEYLKKQVAAQSDVVLVPSVAYHFYPAFVEYPGSVTLRLETARDLIVDICESLARFGPRRFYVLNTGISTVAALAPAAQLLAAKEILLRYTDLHALIEPVERIIGEQDGGSHADEIETSVMLYIDAASVDMQKATKDYHPANGPGGLTRNPDATGVYSPTGTWGDPTLATREKGRRVVEALVKGILKDLDDLRRAPVL